MHKLSQTSDMQHAIFLTHACLQLIASGSTAQNISLLTLPAGDFVSAAKAYEEAYLALCRFQDPEETVSTPSAITVALNCASMHCLSEGDQDEVFRWVGVARCRWVVMYGCGEWFDKHFRAWLHAMM